MLFNWRLVGVALLLVLSFVVARAWALGLLARRVIPSSWDRVAVSLMFPLGLPTAAASLIPWARFHLAGTQEFPGLAALVIACSIVVSSLLVAMAMQPAVRRRFKVVPGAPLR